MIGFLIAAAALVAVSKLYGANKKAPPNLLADNSRNLRQVEATRLIVDTYKDDIAAWRRRWENKIDTTRWIPSSTARRIFKENPPPVRNRAAVKNWRDPIATITEADLKREFDQHNAKHLETQKTRLKSFFETIEKNPLTAEQIKACVCMDDYIQIVAAAGSGKTSTMVAKAGYALREGLATGEQILLLAFNADAASELEERCRSRLAKLDGADKITAKTFHSFGLDVIAKATGKKPRTAPWLDQAAGDLKMIIAIIDELCQEDPEFANDWKLFRTVYGRDVGLWNVQQDFEDYENGRRGFRTANGEIVKSKEELLIANWLFYHHVNYEYERPYERDTADELYSQYHPDFYYPDIKLYHEHFALNADGNPPDRFGRKYLDGVKWKRLKHAAMGTKLFETTSYQIANGSAIKRLSEHLTKHGLN